MKESQYPTTDLPRKPGFAIMPARAGVAQLVEQRTRNAQVRGSNPLSGSKIGFLKNPGLDLPPVGLESLTPPARRRDWREEAWDEGFFADLAQQPEPSLPVSPLIPETTW